MAIMKKIILALGYFDSLHRGHQFLLKTAQQTAKRNNGELLICTFGDDFYNILGQDSKEIFLLNERKKILNDLGYKNIFVFDTTKDFFDKSKEDFLDYLLTLSPQSIVAGADYRFGKNAMGNINDLIDFFQKQNIDVQIVKLLTQDEIKISTTLIKKCLEKGDMEKVNNLLGFDYFISGKVIPGRKQGSKYGFPTANINVCNNKFTPKQGVYVSKINIKGNIYAGITNIGGHPTFDDFSFNAETYIIDFNDNIYGENVEIYILKFIREIKKFHSKQQLAKQIKMDKDFVKGYFNG